MIHWIAKNEMKQAYILQILNLWVIHRSLSSIQTIKKKIQMKLLLKLSATKLGLVQVYFIVYHGIRYISLRKFK